MGRKEGREGKGEEERKGEREFSGKECIHQLGNPKARMNTSKEPP